MSIIYDLATLTAALVFLFWLTNWISYTLIKNRALKERRWDYNICCGTTDGGGVNADIVRHGDVPNFEQVADINRLPHPDGAFDRILCSHTLEHVDDPRRFFAELQRVGRHVTVLIPPIWDVSAALNFLEHRVIFLTFRSRHENTLPPYIRYWPGILYQSMVGQRIDAEARGTAGASPMRAVFDLLVPVTFAGATAVLAYDQPAGFAVGALAVLCLVLSKQEWPAAPAK